MSEVKERVSRQRGKERVGVRKETREVRGGGRLRERGEVVLLFLLQRLNARKSR